MTRLLVMVGVLVLFLTACVVVEECPVSTGPTGGVVTDPTTFHEVTEEDVFALMKNEGVTSSQVTVEGIKLGDGFAEIRTILGMPYSMEEFESGSVVNARYIDERTNLTSLIFHLEDDVITRIVVRAIYNPKLHGETVIDRTKAEITSYFGKPDFFDDAVALRTYYYNDLGLEIYHRRKKMLGFGLIPEGSAEESYPN